MARVKQWSGGSKYKNKSFMIKTPAVTVRDLKTGEVKRVIPAKLKKINRRKPRMIVYYSSFQGS